MFDNLLILKLKWTSTAKSIRSIWKIWYSVCGQNVFVIIKYLNYVLSTSKRTLGLRSSSAAIYLLWFCSRWAPRCYVTPFSKRTFIIQEIPDSADLSDLVCLSWTAQNWKQTSKNRDVWKRVAEEAKALRELVSHRN